MKDIICNAHYCPEYLYYPIIHPSDDNELVLERFSDRFEEFDDYEMWHHRSYYTKVGDEHEKNRAIYAGCDRTGNIVPNWPYCKYDTIKQKEWDSNHDPEDNWRVYWNF